MLFIELPCMQVPQLQLPLLTSKEDFVQVSTWVHQAEHMEGLRIKLKLTINLWGGGGGGLGITLLHYCIGECLSATNVTVLDNCLHP